MKKCISMLLAVFLLVGLMGCGASDAVPEEISGSWKRKGDAGPELKEQILKAWDFSEEDLGYCEPVVMEWDEIILFNTEDMTYTVTVYQDTMENKVQTFASEALSRFYDMRAQINPDYLKVMIDRETFLNQLSQNLDYENYEELLREYTVRGVEVVKDIGQVESGSFSLKHAKSTTTEVPPLEVDGKVIDGGGSYVVYSGTIVFTPEGEEAYEMLYEMDTRYGMLLLSEDGVYGLVHFRAD